MKKFMMILACVLVCFSLFTGCTNQKDGSDQDTNLGNSVEIDDTDIDIDAGTKPGAEDNSDNVSLPDGYTYSFKDPDNTDGIVVTPMEQEKFPFHTGSTLALYRSTWRRYFGKKCRLLSTQNWRL